METQLLWREQAYTKVRHIVDNVRPKTSLFSRTSAASVDSNVDNFYVDTRLRSDLTSCGVGIEGRIRPASL